MTCPSKISIIRKFIMGLTGLALVGFLVTHLAGNLLIFKSADTFNHYSHSLISNPFIYLAEAMLVILFIAHFVPGLMFTKKNRDARPVAYEKKKWAGHTSRKSFASASMIFSGLVILAFVPLHLITFKYGPHYAAATDPQVRDLYRLVMEEFTETGEVIWYALAMGVIGLHLSHGFNSAFESLGIPHRSWIRCAGQGLAVILAVGFAAIPLVIFFKGGHL